MTKEAQRGTNRPPNGPDIVNKIKRKRREELAGHVWRKPGTLVIRVLSPVLLDSLITRESKKERTLRKITIALGGLYQER